MPRGQEMSETERSSYFQLMRCTGFARPSGIRQQLHLSFLEEGEHAAAIIGLFFFAKREPQGVLRKRELGRHSPVERRFVAVTV